MAEPSVGKYVVSLTCDGSRNISKLCAANPNGSYWLSWNLFGKTYQSDAFIPAEAALPRFRDTVHVSCSRTNVGNGEQGADRVVPPQVVEAFPLRLFLCTSETVVAAAVVDPFDANAAVHSLPLEFSAWQDLHEVEEAVAENLPGSAAEAASMRVGVLILSEGSASLPEEGRESLRGDSEEVQRQEDNNGGIGGGGGDDDDDDDDDEEEYGDDDDFEADVPAPPPPAPRAPPANNSKASSKNNNSIDKNNKVQEEDDEADQILRHFRVSVDVRSLGGLRRPAHVSVQFMYPFLGASSPVRSTPLWVQAFTEAKLSGAVASYECAMTRQRLASTLRAHPLRIAALSKSHLGNNILGEVHVDLGAANDTEAHSFRCPLTSRMFKTREDYTKHRQIMLALMAAGKIDRAPAKEPVVIRVVDAYLAVTPPNSVDASKSLNVYTGGVVQGDSSAKVRVVTIIEDIGAVGPETAVTVRPGYKMHNGAVYQVRINLLNLINIVVAAAASGTPSVVLCLCNCTTILR